MQQIILTVAGWFVSVAVAFFIGRHNGVRIAQRVRFQKARDDFHANISALRSKLRARAGYDDRFFQDSLPELQRAVEVFRHFAATEEWFCLDKTLKEYESQDPKKLERSLHKMQADQSIGPKERPDTILAGFLDRFDRCVGN